MTTPTTNNEPWIQTYSGKKFYPLNPRVEDVDILDIAHALSNQCRFSGHTRRFYSVAEHSVRVSRRVGWLYGIIPFQLAGLMHDASEAYLVDLPSPLKHDAQFSGYRQIEQRCTEVIFERFGLKLDWLEPRVKEADLTLLATEAQELMSPLRPGWQTLPSPLRLEGLGWSPDTACSEFLTTFVQLTAPARLP